MGSRTAGTMVHASTESHDDHRCSEVSFALKRWIVSASASVVYGEYHGAKRTVADG